MRRLHPTWKVGELYGVLCLEFSKDKINQMSAAARRNTTPLASCEDGRRVVVAGAVGIARPFGLVAGPEYFQGASGAPGEAKRLTQAAVEGKLQTRGNPELVSLEFRPIVEGVNATLDAVIGPLNVAAEYVDRISKGDIPPKITDTYNGDFNEIKNNLNQCIDAINGLIAEASDAGRGRRRRPAGHPGQRQPSSRASTARSSRA